jgi:hypothetical protein
LYKRDYTSVKAKTIQEYVSEWNRFFKDTELVKMKIGEIKPITLIRFFREATKDRQFTHKRVSNARSVLNGIMSYAIEEEIISHNPVSDVNFKQFTYKPVEVQSDVVNQMKGNTSHGFRKQFLTDESLKILHKAKELNPNGIYVFEPNGEIMTTDSFNRRLKKYCKEAGVPLSFQS